LAFVGGAWSDKVVSKMSGSQTVDRALQVLDAVAAQKAPSRLSDLAHQVGLNISTTSRLLNSLQQHGYVRRDSATGRYRLGYKILYMANVAQEQAGLHEIVDPVLQALVNATNETATLGILQENEAMVIARVTCTNQLRSVVSIGTRVPLYCTSAGQVLLAYLPRERVEQILARGMPRRTPLTMTDPETLLAELQAVRKRGYAVDLGQREEGLVGIAAPVRNVSGNVIASCTISGSEQRIRREMIPALAEHVVAAAMELSKRLGWQPAIQANDSRWSLADFARETDGH
jgi:DNA-binding IclR family transcriptional regulator